MKEQWYPYRFKTKEEFEKNYISSWRNGDNQTLVSFIPDMDYLFGQLYPFDIDLSEYNKSSELPMMPYGIMDHWRIKKFMLTENKPLVPNYKPKEKVVRSL